jgi:hypothetical protein
MIRSLIPSLPFSLRYPRVHLPAVPEWSDFDDRHVKVVCILLQASLPVRLNMTQPSNGQALSPKDNRLLAPKGSQARYTGEILLRTRPKTYRKIVELLAHPDWSVLRISEACRVSRNTVDAVREREAATIEQRKKELVCMLSDVAHIGTGRVADTIGKASVRDAVIGTGVAIDKMLALTGNSPVGVQVAVINMPTPEENAEREAAHRRLDEITRLLREPETPERTLRVKAAILALQYGESSGGQSSRGPTPPQD